jgi:hypothetical protein
MTVIELPDYQAAALTAKAFAQGLSLKDWLKKLAIDQPLMPVRPGPNRDDRPILEIISEQMKCTPSVRQTSPCEAKP